MTTSELTRLIFKRLKKFRYIILAASIILAVLMVWYAKQTPVTLTSRASIFSIVSSPESSSTSSALSVLIGGGESGKSFSGDDASINIVELALSRYTREAVAATKVPSMGNKTIAELSINDINDHLGLLETKIEMPKTQEQLINTGGNILKGGLTAALNKTNTLILTYTGRSEELVRVISYQFIDRISKFYIDLKIEKAKRDFEFATGKVDSLRRVMNSKDYELIARDKTTLFTNTNKLEYRVPTENLIADKQMVRNQYATAVANQQNAAYKLQKATPVIQTLDRPEPPYDIQKKSKVFYGLLGFALGAVLTIGLLISGLIMRFIREETNRMIFGNSPSKATTTTTATVL